MLLPFLPSAAEEETQVYPVVSSALEHTDEALPVKEEGFVVKAETAVRDRRFKKAKNFILISLEVCEE